MTIFYAALIAIHLLACLFLIAVILLQAGRGGGLVESFSISESIFGTKTSSFLQKATTVTAIIFMLTCLGLAFITAQRSKSLVGRGSVLEKMIPLAEQKEAAEVSEVASEEAQKTTEEESVPTTVPAE